MNQKKQTNRKTAPKRKVLAGILQLILVVVLIGGAFMLAAKLASLERKPVPRPNTGLRTLAVQTRTVAPQTHRLAFKTTGTVQVRAFTSIVPQVSGKVVSLNESAFPGGAFEQDEVLFQIEQDDYIFEIDEKEAAVASAQTKLDLQLAESESAVKEWQRMHPDQPVPSLVAKEPQLKEARAALQSAKAQLNTERLNLERTSYSLPFGGRITEINIEQGQYIAPGQSYGLAYALSALEIDIPLKEQEFEWLIEAESPIITIHSRYLGSTSYEAYIKRLSADVDKQTRFARAVLGFKEVTPRIVPNVFVEAMIIGPVRNDVWVLPIEALHENNSIWIVTPENKLHKMTVDIIQIADDHFVAQSDGTQIEVVINNLPDATEGTPVKILNDTASESDNE